MFFNVFISELAPQPRFPDRAVANHDPSHIYNLSTATEDPQKAIQAKQRMKKTVAKAVRVAVRESSRFRKILGLVSDCRIWQGVRVAKKTRGAKAPETAAIIPSDILGEPMEQEQMVVAAPTFPDKRSRSKKMVTVTPTHEKAFNNKPSMAQLSRIQQPK
jgi:ribosomal protein L18E